MNSQKKLEKKIDEKILSNLISKLEIVFKRNMFKYFYNLYMEKYKKETYTLAFNYLLFIIKKYPFKKIEKYSRILEYFEAFKELLRPFIHSKFKTFVRNCLELKIINTKHDFLLQCLSLSIYPNRIVLARYYHNIFFGTVSNLKAYIDFLIFFFQKIQSFP